MTRVRIGFATARALTLLTLIGGARAWAARPGDGVNRLPEALISTMKEGSTLSESGRDARASQSFAEFMTFR